MFSSTEYAFLILLHVTCHHVDTNHAVAGTPVCSELFWLRPLDLKCTMEPCECISVVSKAIQSPRNVWTLLFRTALRYTSTGKWTKLVYWAVESVCICSVALTWKCSSRARGQMEHLTATFAASNIAEGTGLWALNVKCIPHSAFMLLLQLGQTDFHCRLFVTYLVRWDISTQKTVQAGRVFQQLLFSVGDSKSITCFKPL